MYQMVINTRFIRRNSMFNVYRWNGRAIRLIDYKSNCVSSYEVQDTLEIRVTGYKLQQRC